MSHETTEPTYCVSGAVTRFDERDSVFARERLKPGSELERIYHRMHPELAVTDRRLARFIEHADSPEGSTDQLNSALYTCTFDPIAGLARPDVVDGEVASRQVQLNSSTAAQRIKSIARHLGADEVRIGPLNQNWVYSHRGTPPFFDELSPNPPHFHGLPEGYNGQRWGDPIELPHHTAISMAFSQDHELLRSGGTPFSDFEVGRVYALSALVATQVAAYLRALGWSARAHHLRHYDVLVVPVAVDAGLGELGRCGYLINKRLGTNLRLACVTTDLPLRYDKPIDLGVQDFCHKCLKCADTCPPRAIPDGEPVDVRGVRKWKIDEEKCLLYWGHIGSACSICQTVCPWSKLPTPFHRLVSEVATRIPASRRFLVWADDRVYGRRFRSAAPPSWACLPPAG